MIFDVHMERRVSRPKMLGGLEAIARRQLSTMSTQSESKLRGAPAYAGGLGMAEDRLDMLGRVID